MRRFLRAIFDWRHLLPVLSIIAVASLMLSTYAVVGYIRGQDQREKDRVAADLASCELGNELIGQVVDVANATESMVDSIIDTLVERADPERREAIAEALAPSFEAYDEAVAEIETNDCDALIKGSVRLPSTVEQVP